MHATTQRLFDALKAIENIDGHKEPGQVAKFLGESQAVITNWKTRGVSKAGMLLAHSKARISPHWIATGIGQMRDGDSPDKSGIETTMALKAKLKDWRMQASPRSVQVIDQLSLLAEKDALREDDWLLIEQLAKRLKQTQ